MALPIIHRHGAPAGEATPFAAAIAAGLSSTPKQVSPSWLYDDLGSALFEAICELPWYRVTRAERALLAREAASLRQASEGVDLLVELGPGSGEKLALVVAALTTGASAPAVHLVDVSPAALAAATRTLQRAGVEDITTANADYFDGIDTLGEHRRGRARALVAFLGSNIGNFHWTEATALLRRMRTRLTTGDRLLLGVDLVKPEAELVAAYDDPLGVTAAFDKNLLVRINRELGANIDLATFAHRAVWNQALRRVEMHLVSLREQRIPIPAADVVASFAEGEWIWTESSYKFERDQLDALAGAVGLHRRHTWTDESAQFALSLLTVP
jgi:dimethylhistidine N-methyltransferase